MAAEVICQQEMTYAGTLRYRGEIFRLIGARNDDALVRVGHVRPITSEMEIERVVDDSGREFIDERTRQLAREQMGDVSIVVKRRPGRPKGSKNRATA